VRVVLDTNVIFAALLVKGLCREVFQRTVRAGALTSSPELVAELEDVVTRKLEPAPAVARFLKEFRQRARLVRPAALPATVCRDPADDVVLATALAARAPLIVTGDGDLLVLGQYQGIRILTPRQFLELLDRQ